jgi:hypothetical protein
MEELLINSVDIISRLEATEYVDGISKKVYKEQCKPVKCRISSLNYKDLQLLQDVDNVEIKVQKMYTMADVEIKPTDYIRREGKEYQVISKYRAQDENGAHHYKYFIKLVD